MTTPTSSHRTISRRRRALLLLALILLPLLAFEVGIRVLIAAGRLPVAVSHSTDLDERWRKAASGPVRDILVLGDSLTAQGIDPRVLADGLSGLADDKGGPVTAASLAVPGGSFGLLADLVRQLERDGRLPKAFVLGISEAMLEHDGGSYDTFLRSRMGQQMTGCGLATSPGDWLDCQAGRISAFWRWHGLAERISSAVGLGTGDVLRADGFPPADGLSVAELTDLVPRALRLAEATPALSPVAEAGFGDLMAALRHTGVPVVALAVPFSPPYQDGLEQRQAGWEASRQALLQHLEQAGDLSIHDPLRFGDWWGDGSSRDPRHLSTKGAKAFTRQLLQMPDVREALEAALGTTGSPTASPTP
jgi:hypothetical protein